ncbi:MAG: hypothetical protein RLZZ515_2235, partial [Cyanobacteriota bacterium]
LLGVWPFEGPKGGRKRPTMFVTLLGNNIMFALNATTINTDGSQGEGVVHDLGLLGHLKTSKAAVMQFAELSGQYLSHRSADEVRIPAIDLGESWIKLHNQSFAVSTDKRQV